MDTLGNESINALFGDTCNNLRDLALFDNVLDEPLVVCWLDYIGGDASN